jgi:hypothetical protein
MPKPWNHLDRPRVLAEIAMAISHITSRAEVAPIFNRYCQLAFDKNVENFYRFDQELALVAAEIFRNN